MYEMEGPCPASPRRADQLPGSADATRRPPVPDTRARDRLPGSSHVPGVTPRWYPFPTVKAFLLPPRARAQDPAVSKFRVSPLSTRYAQKAGSYPHLTVVIHRLAHSMSTSNRM